MGKRYFCDYCQRSFIDDIDSRKKHLNGVAHLRLKREYYAVSRDMKTLLEEERAKQVCRRFRNTGDCQFGFSCNHTHYSEEELASFERMVKDDEEQMTRVPNVDDWLEKRHRGKEVAISNKDTAVQGFSSGNYVCVQNPEVPPSLRPPTLDEIRSSSTVSFEWG